MNFDISVMPATIDMVHAGLAVLALVFFILYITKNGNKGQEQQSTAAVTIPTLKESSPDSACQLLSLLQQEARFIDFINEDLSGFSDGDIGAAARVVHEGSQKVFGNYLDLAPVRQEEEGARITIEEGFNAGEVRLTGNVVGEAPFKGILVHRGWKMAGLKLPKLAKGHDPRVLAPAEVEL